MGDDTKWFCLVRRGLVDDAKHWSRSLSSTFRSTEDLVPSTSIVILPSLSVLQMWVAQGRTDKRKRSLDNRDTDVQGPVPRLQTNDVPLGVSFEEGRGGGCLHTTTRCLQSLVPRIPSVISGEKTKTESDLPR